MDNSRNASTPVDSFETQDYAGSRPIWSPINAATVRTLPWNALCSIRILDGNNVTYAAGTGWAAGLHTIITAAHVIALPIRGKNDLRAQVKFPSDNSTTIATAQIFHKDYTGNVNQYFDPHDIAALRIPTSAPSVLTLGRPPSTPTNGRIGGFPNLANGTMVAHQNLLIPIDINKNILLHKIETERGHSGAPVFLPTSDNQVVGIHVHGWAGNPYDDQWPTHNVALAMNRVLAQFIVDHVEAWG